MKHHFILAAALTTALSGCATTGMLPGAQLSTNNPIVSKEEKADARRSAFKSGANVLLPIHIDASRSLA